VTAKEIIMLKSAATALAGIIVGILATAPLGVSPSAAQQLRSKLPCNPVVKDWNQCNRHGRVEHCQQITIRAPSASYGCVWETHCKELNRRCWGPIKKRP
jgi:hypothetical protein